VGVPYRLPLQTPSADQHHYSPELSPPLPASRQLIIHSAILIIWGFLIQVQREVPACDGPGGSRRYHQGDHTAEAGRGQPWQQDASGQDAL